MENKSEGLSGEDRAAAELEGEVVRASSKAVSREQGGLRNIQESEPVQ